jgi:DNA-binding response OmpR family regulator
LLTAAAGILIVLHPGCDVDGEGDGMASRRVLVVEDSFVVAQNVCEALRAAGFEARSAADLAAARAAAADWRPDVALVDLALRQRFDGIEAARWLAIEHGARIVFISAYQPCVLPPEARAAFDELAAAFVGKPPESGALAAAVRAALGEP